MDFPRHSWLCFAGIMSFCVFLILTILGGPRIPTTLTIDEIIDPVTGQSRTPEEQSHIIQRKILKSQAFELLISAFVFLGITVLTCGMSVLFTNCQRRIVLIIPSISTFPPQTHSSSTKDDPAQTWIPIAPVTLTQLYSLLPQG